MVGIRKRNSPGCTCCAIECLVEDDIFSAGGLTPWTEQSGTWTETGGLMTTLSPNGVLLYTSLTNWNTNWRVTVSAGTTDAFSEHRIIFGWVDSNNYWYVMYKTVGTGPTEEVYLELWKVESGSATDLASIMKVGSDFVSNSAPIWQTVSICYHSGMLFVHGGANPSTDLFLQVAATPPQGTFGLGSGAIDGSNEVRFTEWRLDYNVGGPGVCVDCPDNICCDGYGIPETVTISLDDFPAPFYEHWNDDYVVPIRGVIGSPNDYDDGCMWEVVFALPDPIPSGEFTLWYIRVERLTSTTQIRVTLGWVTPTSNGSDVATVTYDPGESWTTSPCHDQWDEPIAFSGGPSPGNVTIEGIM